MKSSPAPEVVTPSVRAALAAAAARLAAAGVPEARREAVRLWAGLAGTTPGAVTLRAAEAADAALLAKFEAGLGRCLAGEPIPYVTGSTGFRRLVLACDRRALIPRPETETLVDLALGLAPTGNVLDLGTGSGCIALALADEGAYDSITGVDRSLEALALARENAGATGLAVRWLAGDWCDPVLGERFDLVVANPPYISEPEWDRLDRSVRDWEPRSALAAGPEGLDDVRGLLREVPAVLAPSGWLVMEIDSTRASASAEAAVQAGWTTVRVADDLFGRPRFLVVRREC